MAPILPLLALRRMTGPLPVPALRGSTVMLRPHLATDLDAVFERCVDEQTKRFTTIPLDYTREMAEEYLATITEPSPLLISWAIEVGGEYAGTIDLRVLPVDAGAGSLGFVTHPRFRGRGVMSQAVGLVVGHALDTLGWRLVRWEAHAGNWGSAKAVWRNGFPIPTFVPDALVERGTVVDGWISTLHAGRSREPVAPWEQVYAALAAASE
jgi:RimJ/RimL family protein N-acetyltransferase